MRKKGVIFDMDGLMFDTQRIYDQAYHDVGLRDYGVVFTDEMLASMAALSGDDMYRRINSFFPDLDAPEFMRRGLVLYRERIAAGITPMPGLEVLLSYLMRQDCRIGLNSGSVRDIVEKNLGNAGLSGCFSGILCGDEISVGKPDPEGYLRVAAMIGCDPADCYVLEDSVNGILAGYRAGCSVIMVPNGVEPDDGIRSMCAGVYKTLADVREAMEAGIL